MIHPIFGTILLLTVGSMVIYWWYLGICAILKKKDKP